MSFETATPRPTKKFTSYDSLRFETDRLETFIKWPVEWIKPEDLAKDGFYYLRTADHCACVFCRGIVGSWEYEDNPRSEHKRHFPHCPFIKGQPVGNIPVTQSNIILGIAPKPNVFAPVMSSTFSALGLPPHTGPKRKEFLSPESREDSFKGKNGKWPDTLKQNPKELADAGFFYCGLSDHVRCFHCNNGIRNWEEGDDPWEEHARWYPECYFVQVEKGHEFIDRVRREKPPYQRTQPQTLEARPLPERDLDLLMELDNNKELLKMGFPVDSVRAALKKNLELKGLPFLRLENGIESVLRYMEEVLSLNPTVTHHRSTSPSNTEVPKETESTIINPTQETLSFAIQDNATSEHATCADPSSTIPRLFSESMVVNDSATEEPQNLAAEVEDEDLAYMCKVCMDAPLEQVFLPCRHMVTCNRCSFALTHCPICRNAIEYSFKPIRS